MGFFLFQHLGWILSNYFCCNWTAIKLLQDFDVSDAQWVFKWTYLCLLLRIRTLSSWWCKCTDSNPFCAWNNASKIAILFKAVVLQSNWVYSIGLWSRRGHKTCPNFIANLIERAIVLDLCWVRFSSFALSILLVSCSSNLT